MIPRSSIAWTDFSGGNLNFVIGCTPVSEGCANCYARAIIHDRGRRDFSRVWLYGEKARRLLKASFADKNKPFRRGPGSRPMAFVVDLGDLFHPDVPEAFIAYVLWVMERRADVDWQILTKRPERMEKVVNEWVSAKGWSILPSNIWCGVTVENQSRAAERIPHLIATRAAVCFLSLEPMLGPIDLVRAIGEPNDYDWDVVNAIDDGEPEEFIEECEAECDWINYGNDQVENPEHREWETWRMWRARLNKLERSIDWIIVGGESGPHRRPFDPDWARAIRDLCQLAEIPFFYKQGAAFRPGQDKLLDGQTWQQFP